MVQDPARESEADMDTTHQSAYTQKSEGTPSGPQPGPSKLSSPDAELMGQLFRAHQAGTLADVTSQLQGPQAEQLQQLMQLAQAVAQPTGAGQGKTLKQPETGPDSQPESDGGSESESDSVRTDASGSQGCKSAQPLEDSDQDVIILDEQQVAEGFGLGQTVLWGTQAKPEQPTEAEWATRFPIRKPYVKPRVVRVDGHWYQGEDCLDPSGIAPVA